MRTEPPPTPAPPSVRSAPVSQPETLEPEIAPAKPMPIKVRRQAQATKRRTRRKAKRDGRIAKVAEWAKSKPSLAYAEMREKRPGKVDFYTECRAAISEPDLPFREYRDGVKIERNRKRAAAKAEAEAAAQKS